MILKILENVSLDDALEYMDIYQIIQITKATFCTCIFLNIIKIFSFSPWIKEERREEYLYYLCVSIILIKE